MYCFSKATVRVLNPSYISASSSRRLPPLGRAARSQTDTTYQDKVIVSALDIQYFGLDSPIRSFQFSKLGLAGVLEDIARYLDQCLTYQPYSIPVRLKLKGSTYIHTGTSFLVPIIPHYPPIQQLCKLLLLLQVPFLCRLPGGCSGFSGCTSTSTGRSARILGL